MRITILVLAGIFCASTAFAAAKLPARHPPPNELDNLFSTLAKAGSEEEAKPIEEKILTAFFRSDSPTVDLLMTRAAAAAHAGAADTAKKLISSVTAIAPDYAEGWHQRAELQDDAGDDQGAMYCLEKTVTLNPRHFEALTELGSKIEEYGDKPGALRLYRKALALDPYFEDVARKVRSLEHEVEGESL
ncbi:MAG: hypothetical protein ACJ8IR_09660 [Alphaproteobacteria bacterium]|jgi:tetratricopeptide (TPR) repeat protein